MIFALFLHDKLKNILRGNIKYTIDNRNKAKHERNMSSSIARVNEWWEALLPMGGNILRFYCFFGVKGLFMDFMGFLVVDDMEHLN